MVSHIVFATVVAPTNHFHHLTLENSGLLRKISRPYAQAVLQYFQTAKVQLSAQKNGERIPWLLLFLDFCSPKNYMKTWVSISSLTNPIQPAWILVLVVWFFLRSQFFCPFQEVFMSFSCYQKPCTEPWWPDQLLYSWFKKPSEDPTRDFTWISRKQRPGHLLIWRCTFSATLSFAACCCARESGSLNWGKNDSVLI